MKKIGLIIMAAGILLALLLFGCSKPSIPTTSPSTVSPSPSASETSPSTISPPSTWHSAPATIDNIPDSEPAVLQSGLDLKVIDPEDASTLTTDNVIVKGQTSPGALVNVNDRVGTADDQGYFSIPISLDEGPYAIDIIAADKNGNQGEVLLLVNVDLSGSGLASVSDANTDSSTDLPLNVSEPVDGADIAADTITVKGQTAPGAVVNVNDQVDVADDNGNFSITVDLASGPNAIDVIASDENGNQNEIILMVNAE